MLLNTSYSKPLPTVCWGKKRSITLCKHLISRKARRLRQVLSLSSLTLHIESFFFSYVCNSAFSATGEYEFWFQNEANRGRFALDPWRYAPKYGGF